jgi:restriction system protein
LVVGDPSAITDIDCLHWREFEKLVQELFERLGYETKYVGGKRDHGADVIASRNGTRIAIQVKHRGKKHRSGNLRWTGERGVQQVVTALPLYECSHGIVVTNTTFAPKTAEVADAHGIELWDRERLIREMASFCVLCGDHVSERVREWCLDRPEEFGGRVYCFKHQRRVADVLRKAE